MNHCVPLALLFVAGCANPADYPSLSPRPVEKLAPVAEPDPTSPDPAADQAPLSPEVAAALGEVNIAEAKFRAELAATDQAVAAARGAATGGEAWAVAEQAMSRAEGARAPIAAALATINAARLGAGAIPSAALEAAHDHVVAIDQADATALAAVTGRLPRP